MKNPLAWLLTIGFCFRTIPDTTHLNLGPHEFGPRTTTELPRRPGDESAWKYNSNAYKHSRAYKRTSPVKPY